MPYTSTSSLPGVHCIEGVGRLLTGASTSLTWTGSTIFSSSLEVLLSRGSLSSFDLASIHHCLLVH
eukprot:1818201-Rhodomonas_salina.1